MSIAMTTFQDVEAYLARLPARSKSFQDRLAYVRLCLAKLGNPQDSVPAIHIAGTSGKGSTAYFASALLVADGYKVGTIVSPHVSSIAERSQINGFPLAEPEYCGYFAEFVSISLDQSFEFTYIECMTVFSYWLFARFDVDYLVIEVGLGGRLDSTNVMTRNDKVCVITSIGFDHVELLGDTLAKIANEKAGIILPGNLVISYEQDLEIMNVMRAAVAANAANLTIADEPHVTRDSALPSYQQHNFHLALQAVNRRLGYDNEQSVSDEAVRVAQAITIPGRYERFTYNDQTIILDGAHNTQKITALVDSLAADYNDRPFIGVVSFGKNKLDSVKDSIAELAQVTSHIVVTEFLLDFDGPIQAADTASLIHLAETNIPFTIQQDPYQAFAFAQSLAAEVNAGILVTGSFYLVSNIRALLIDEQR